MGQSGDGAQQAAEPREPLEGALQFPFPSLPRLSRNFTIQQLAQGGALRLPQGPYVGQRVNKKALVAKIPSIDKSGKTWQHVVQDCSGYFRTCCNSNDCRGIRGK